MNSLIIGMGFGNAVYRPVLESLGHTVVTVDPYRDADYKTVQEAVDKHKFFDTVNICTPNYTHESLAREVAPYTRLIFVEKPGVVDAKCWQCLTEDFSATRIVMVKNNQFRTEIEYFQELSEKSSQVCVVWSSNNRVPNPGSWFTNKELAFGGVSRDLMPHALSYYLKLADWHSGKLISSTSKQRYQLKDITSTDYGHVDVNGVYNVDDYCELVLKTNTQTWTLITDWKSNSGIDEVSIDFEGKRFELGLCPEQAYEKMITTAFKNLNNESFWEEQYRQDIFIHQLIEKI